MRTLIIAKRMSLGKELLAEIIRIPPDEIHSDAYYLLAKFRNGDTVEIRLISSILRGLKVDMLYLPENIDPRLTSEIIPILMFSPYQDCIKYYSGGRVC